MKFIRNNLAYLILGAVALILIFITISLQVSILSARSTNGAERGFWATVQEQLAGWLAPVAPTAEDENGPVGNNVTVNDALSDTAATDAPNVDAQTGQAAANTTAADATPTELAVATSSAAATTPETVAALSLTGMAAALYNAESVTVSEDDDILATIISNNPQAIGFFGYAYYRAHQDRLRTIAIRLPDGQLVAPNATSVASGLYPLARPLYLYTSPTILRQKLDVERFIGCYLRQLPLAITDVGYLLPNRQLFGQAIQSFNASCQECRRELVTNHPLADTVPICDAATGVGTPISIVGSSTLEPLTDRMARLFTERGFRGTIEVDGSGTGAGFRTFCTMGQGDIVDASRLVTDEERAACNAAGRALVPFPIAVDALAIVVSRANTYLQDASLEELPQIFAYARRWSDINASWPDASIVRAIPGAQSGTFDYFVGAVMEGNALRQLADLRANPLSDASALAGSPAPATPTSTPIGSGVFLNNQPDVRIGYVETDTICAANSSLVALILQHKYGLRVTSTAYPDIDALFKDLSAKDAKARVDLTFCYKDPSDRAVRQRYFSYTEFIGSGYQANAAERYVIVSNSSVKAPLERSNRCLYQFLNRMNWDEIVAEQAVWDMQSVNPWYDAHLTQIDGWTTCDLS